MFKKWLQSITVFFRKKNSHLATKFGRRFPSRFINQTVVGVWRTLYERTGLEKFLQSTPRGQTPSTILSKTKTTDTGGNKGGVGQSINSLTQEEEEIKKREKIKRLNRLFESESFKEFIEFLQEAEAFDLEELVRPTLKKENLSFDQYSFLLRGRLEVYEAIREKIKEVKSLAKKYAL